MRPAHKTFSAGRFGWFESGLVLQLEALLIESIRTWSFDRYRFAEANPDSQLLFHSQREKVNF
jgi:hypothetical protein